MKAYEVEVSFIGEHDFYYFETRREAEKAAREINSAPAESAYWGEVKSEAWINEIELAPYQHIEGGEIVTIYRRA